MAPFLCLSGTKPIYASLPSLERVATLKVAIALWNRDDIITLVNDDHNNGLHLSFLRWNVNELLVPEHIKKSLWEVIRNIDEEIRKWKDYHERCFNDLPHFRIQLPAVYLTTFPFGAIDWAKTAQALVKDTNMHIDLRYRIACNFCFENDIVELWNVMADQNIECSYHYEPIESRRSATAGRWLKLLPYYIFSSWNILHVMWNVVLEKKAVLKDMLQQEEPDLVVKFLTNLCFDNNKVAIQYLLPYTTDDMKNSIFEKVMDDKAQVIDDEELLIDDEDLEPECFYYLLSQMNETQQARFLKKSKYSVAVVLCRSLCFSWQDLFMPIANSLRPILSKDDSLLIMEKIAWEGDDDSVCPQLFAEFWQSSCDSHKRYAIEMCARVSQLLNILFENRYKRNIQLIWDYCTVEDKKNIIARYKEESSCRKKECHNVTWVYKFLKKLL